MSVLKKTVFVLLLWGMFVQGAARAEEPYELFLEKLKDQQLFDVALDYLSYLENQRGIESSFKTNLELERGLLLYQSAAVMQPTNPLRNAKLDEAEKALRKFVSEQKNHPRRGDARMKIGELLLQRADEAKGIDPDPSQENAMAVGYYDEAHKLFEGTLKELAAILQNLKGARIDPKDTRKVAYRTKIQQDYRQAQLLSAKSVEERGRARGKGGKQNKADLEKALKMFSELYSKEQKNLGVRNYALFYRSSIHSELGMASDAIDGFQRVADLEGVDVLRPLQTKAITELVRLLEKEAKFPVAVSRGEKWLADLRPDEQKLPETVELKQQIAKTKIAWTDKLKAEDPQDRVASRMIRDTRTDLRSLLRIPGSHLAETRELLKKLGAGGEEPEESQELPTVKTFSEAVAEAQKRLEKLDDDTLPAETIDLAIDQSIALLREAIRLYTPNEDREQLDQVHYSLAYALVKAQDLYEAIVVADFLARRNPNTQKGLDSAGLALRSFGYLLRTADDEAKRDLTVALEPFATFLVETWPESTEASAAASALVQLALVNQEWDKVDRFLAMAPAGGSTAKLRRDAGLSFYARYLAELKEGGETENTNTLKARALESMKAGTSSLTKADVDRSVVETLNAYARLLLADGNLEEAVKVFSEGPTAPLSVLTDSPELAGGKVAMNCYRTAIQLTIAQMSQGELDSKQAVETTNDYIQRLQKVAGDSAEGKRDLAGMFVGLASDLKEQMQSVPDGNQRKKMSEALGLVAKEAAKADSFNTQYWAADTIIGLADELNASRDGKPLAQSMYGEAASILDRILSKEAQQPGWIQPEGFQTQIKLRLAMCRRGIGEFKEALNQLGAILEANAGLLEVQEEAAKTYQLWGDAQYPQLHKGAYQGGRPNTRGQKLFWGWGKIAQVLEGKAEYKDRFYKARYNLALSRYKHALSMQGKDKTDELKRAERDVSTTATIYPELGGAEQKKQFNTLLQTIQKALGKPAKGLAGLQS